MKKTKLFLTLFLTLVAAFGFIACGDNNAVSGEPNEWGHRPVSFSYASVQGREGWDYNTGDDYGLYYSNRFNYQMEFTALNWDNWAERVRIWISSMDMPDVVVYDYVHAEAATFVEQGLVYRFPDNWKERWPNAARFYDLTSLGPYLDDLFGGTYFYPRARFADFLPGNPLQNHWTMWMRLDWMEAVGFPVKSTYTLHEIMDYLRLIQARDPGNVGPGLIPLAGSPNNVALLFLQSNFVHWNTFYRDPADGVYKWGAANPRTLEGLRLMYEAYSTGLLDSEFYLLNTGQDMEKLEVTLQAASIFEQGPTGVWRARRIEFERRNPTMPGDDHIHGATILGTDGNYHQRDLINFWGTIIFRPNVSQAVFERWMDVMDWNSTREGYVMTNLGFRGREWEFNTDGSVRLLVPQGTSIFGAPGVGRYPSGGYILGSTLLFDDFSFESPNIEERYRNQSWEAYQDRSRFSTPDTFTLVDWTLYTYDSPNMRRATFNYANEFSNMVTNATSMAHLEQLYNNWINGQMGIIQPVLNELNALR